jgi:hypothetical protein
MKRPYEICHGSAVTLVESGEDGGAFAVRFHGVDLRVIASWGCGWDHVSVSLPNRCPIWEEMVHVKRLFYLPDEWAMELHPAQGRNVNCHRFCLHLWRPQHQVIPVPPAWMIGPMVTP